MNAGRMKHRVTIKQPVTSIDAHGSQKDTWTGDGTTVATVWAHIKPVRAYEQMQAQRLGVEVSHIVTIRYRSGITEKMRLAWGNRTLNITGVRNLDEADKWLELFCMERR